jgi:hypothetical protein
MSARRKGKHAELEAVKVLASILPELKFRRSAQVTMMQGVPDLQLLPEYGNPDRVWIEVKARKAEIWPCELRDVLARGIKYSTPECRLIVCMYRRDHVGWFFYTGSRTSTVIERCTAEELREKILDALR